MSSTDAPSAEVFSLQMRSLVRQRVSAAQRLLGCGDLVCGSVALLKCAKYITKLFLCFLLRAFVWGLTFKGIICLGLVFMYPWGEGLISFSAFSLLCAPDTVCENQLCVPEFISALSVSVFIACTILCSRFWNQVVWCPWIYSFLLYMTLAAWTLCWYHMNIRVDFSSSLSFICTYLFQWREGPRRLLVHRRRLEVSLWDPVLAFHRVDSTESIPETKLGSSGNASMKGGKHLPHEPSHQTLIFQ